MKKILAAFVLAAVALSGVSAKKSIKDKIDEEKIGKFKEVNIDEGTFRLKKSFGSALIPTEYTIKLYSDDGSVGIFYKTDLASKESLRFDKDAREALRKAYAQYLEDYEGKKLKKSKKFVEAYGYTRAKIVWKMISDSATAHPKIYFGYAFNGKSPYFCIKVNQTNAEEKKGDIVVQYIGTVMYFTRAQAKEIIDAMDDAKIAEALESTVLKVADDSEYDDGSAEGYEEAEEEPVKEKKSKKYKKVEEVKEPENLEYTEDE